MSMLQDRIAQFRNMTEAEPDDELGHFRLAQLLAEDGQHADAAKSFQRAVVIEPNFSKVYQLLGLSQKALGRVAEAVETWTTGWRVAENRGDRIPRDEMAKLLKEHGAPVPEAPKQADEDLGPETGFKCRRSMCAAGRHAVQLAAPPLADDPVYERIYQEICAACWKSWLSDFSFKVINELRLDLSSEFGQEEYDKNMFEFFDFEWTPPAKAEPK